MTQVEVEKRHEKWRKEIQEQQESGLSIIGWCKQKGINRSSFYKHLKFVQREQGIQTAQLNTKSDCIDLSFASIELSERKANCTTGISIELLNGTIQIGPDAKEEHVRIILQELKYA